MNYTEYGLKMEEAGVDHCWTVGVVNSFLSQLWEMFQNKKALCGKWLSQIRLYAQVKNSGESSIMLNFHLIRGLIAYGRWARESPALKILALIAQD